jgi:Fe-S-cluster containining protein
MDIYNEIPNFACKPGCSECCGIAPIAPVEFANISEWIALNGVETRLLTTDLLTCPYVVNDRCAIYPVRPTFCRLFGAVDDEMLRCPDGGQEVRLISKVEADLILEHVFALELQ